MGSSTESSAYGPTQPVIDRVPGGSSGGSAAARPRSRHRLAIGSGTPGVDPPARQGHATVGDKPLPDGALMCGVLVSILRPSWTHPYCGAGHDRTTPRRSTARVPGVK